ncbi:MAG: ABC transporter ATP-binding protein [Candidatus Undinarchaeales archaeon]|jgi:ABC-2 type transport system ATP-binding protein|nr:ABC transporter ATP-binding protein [Candidatus Undinarchaeales archaeon]MDP7492787.1 ABC transporter ATP-binding protein [Candidatus Undinarchaeales archaeon]
MAEPAIKTTELVRTYGATNALRGVSLSVEKGEVVGLLGPNGAGKTTLIKILTGLILPTSGAAFVDGIDVTDEPIRVKERIGYLPEVTAMYGAMTAGEFLRFMGGFYPIDVEARLDMLSERFRLEELMDSRISILSKGMARRVALARAVINDPHILFLDEPTTGLDPLTRATMHELVVDLQSEGKTILLCTHDLTEADKLCDRVAIIDDGRVLVTGAPGELKRRIEKDQRVEVTFRGEVPDLKGARRVGPRDFAVRVLRGEEEDVRKAVKKAKAQIVETRLLYPSLERVFTHYVLDRKE